MLRDLIAVRNIERHRSASLGGIPWRVYGIAGVVRQFHQARREPYAFFSNRRDSRPPEDLRALCSSVERWNHRRPIEPAKGACRVLHRLLEGKRSRVRLPACERGLEL